MRASYARPGVAYAALILSLTAATLSGQRPDSYPPPKIQFVDVEPDVRLEVIDWGGRGRAVVLLAGGGDTAHIYDQFAPKLTPEYHVFGITRRGFGASSKPKTGYSAESLANDVLHVLDALKLERPVLAGHSAAGEEMSSIGARYSNRIAALIYLDAAWDNTYVLPKDNERSADFDKVGIPSQPKPDPERFDPRDALGAGVEKPDYAHIRVPALALYAAPRTWQEMMPGAPEFSDPERRAAAERVVAYAARTRKFMEDTFRSGVANSRVVEVRGASHYLFQTHEADVLRNMREFLEIVKQQRTDTIPR
jgi:pimeloyl-ACP methyl ester carboxylesterase